MFKFFKRRQNKSNKPQTKSRFNLGNYRQLQARQNVPPRYNDGGSR
ncbi:MAG: hypothetical protein WBA77_13495 [Microcoleaceae cyanobacterium]